MASNRFIPDGIEVNEYSGVREKAYRDVVESFEGVVDRLEEGETLSVTITHHSDSGGIWYETWYTITSSDKRGAEWPVTTDSSVVA